MKLIKNSQETSIIKLNRKNFRQNKLAVGLGILGIYSVLVAPSIAYGQGAGCTPDSGSIVTCSGDMTETIKVETNVDDINITTSNNFSIKTASGDAVTLINQDTTSETYDISFKHDGTGSIIGAKNGIVIENKSGGATELSTGANVIGLDGQGISIDSFSDDTSEGNVDIAVNNVTGKTDGIYVNAQTSGYIDLKASGHVVGETGAGITTGLAFGKLIVSANNVTGATSGIHVESWAQKGGVNPEIDITTNGLVEGKTEHGIYINQMGSDVIVRSNNVIGKVDGIQLNHYGKFEGAAEQESTKVVADISGTVIGMEGSGVNITLLNSSKTDISANVNIQESGIVKGKKSAVSLDSGEWYSENSSAKVVNAGVIENTQGSDHLAIGVTGKFLTSDIVNNGTINGTVNLSAKHNNLVTNIGTWNTAGGTNSFSGDSSVVTNSGSIIAAKSGEKSTTNFNGLTVFNNTGIINMQNDIAGDVTTIDGDYVGGGSVTVDSAWNNPDEQKNDKLIINGKVSGITTVSAKDNIILGNVTQNDIEKNGGWLNAVIEVNGEDASQKSFVGSAETEGAAQAQLVWHDNNYYWTLQALSKDPLIPLKPSLYSEGISGYVNMPRANMEAGYSTLGTLHERRGENQILSWDGCEPCTGDESQSWVRVFNQKVNQDGQNRLGLDSKTYGFQVGYDFSIEENDKGGHRLTGGYIAYSYTDTDFSDKYRAENGIVVADKHTGKGTSESFSLGVINTYYAADGGYVDLVGQFSYLHNKYKSRNGINKSQNGLGLALSVEVGKPFLISENTEKDSNWIIEPQAQLVYQYVKLKKFNDGYRDIDQGNQQGLRGRVGFRLAYNAKNGNNRTDSYYLVGNVWHDFDNPQSVKIGQDHISEKFSRSWGEVGLGMQSSINNKGSYLYIDARYMRDLDGTKRDGYRATVGLKYNL